MAPLLSDENGLLVIDIIHAIPCDECLGTFDMSSIEFSESI